MTNPIDQALATLASWLLLACAAWAVLLCAAAVLEASTSGRMRATAWVGCPAPLRRLLLTGLGIALASGAGSAHAATGSHRATDTEPPALPVPARPVGASLEPAFEPLGAPTIERGRVTVRPGDSLWRLASDRLGAQVSAGAVADLVARLHDRNRRVLGPDPDLIRPGQRLVVPPLPRSSTRHLLEERP